ncbi:hypothetical protein BH11PLA1_BH11PLA1_19010 [soil metagenome]
MTNAPRQLDFDAIARALRKLEFEGPALTIGMCLILYLFSLAGELRFGGFFGRILLAVVLVVMSARIGFRAVRLAALLRLSELERLGIALLAWVPVAGWFVMVRLGRRARQLIQRAGFVMPPRWETLPAISALPTAHCLRCGYDVRGVIHLRCPECGGPIGRILGADASEPDDPRPTIPESFFKRRGWELFGKPPSPPEDFDSVKAFQGEPVRPAPTKD